MASFSTPKFEAAVTRFKGHFTGHTQLFEYGQFYVTDRTFDDLIAAANRVLPPAPSPAAAFIPFLTNALNQPVHSIDFNAIKLQLDALQAIGIDVSPIRGMLTPGAPDLTNAQADYNAVWSNANVLPIPTMTAASVRKYLAAFDLEKGKCFATVRTFAAKLLKARGAPASLPVAKKISQGVIAGATVQGVPGPLNLQNVVYGNVAGLGPVVGLIKGVLDLDCVVQSGLLSGLRHENSAFPNPEHYILLIAYDNIGGDDAFLFWDPDAAATQIASTTWGRGFGVLFLAGGRFSTAVDAVDLNNLNTDGEHMTEPKRHRYQVYYAQSLPI